MILEFWFDSALIFQSKTAAYHEETEVLKLVEKQYIT